MISALNGLELFGHEKGNIEVFHALRELGAKVCVGVNASDNGGAVGRHLQDLGFAIFPLPFRPQWSLQWLKKEGPMYGLRHLGAVWQCSRSFSREIRKFQPTHIQLGSELAYSFLSLALACHRRIPLIWRMGDCPPVESPFNFRIWKAGMGRTTRVVANSEYVRASAVAAGVDAQRISRIYNLAPMIPSGESSKPPPLRDHEFAIMYVGAISEHKGVMTLIDAFAKVVADHQGARLWLLGASRWDGDFRTAVVARVQELGLERFVFWAGQVTDVDGWFRWGSLHVCPSIWEEPSANVVMEAKRAGLPSVVFPSGGLPEMIRHGVDGYVCEEKTVESLTSAMNGMLANLERTKTMGVAARADYEDRFGPERFRQEWAEIYTSTALP
ncbi:MAG: glycosyltransferase family 4 protein [Verrucomicrobiales bacterium]|nr:glycosyltransferase family 4 protein [Verrucomicrobiales bacterium]